MRLAILIPRMFRPYEIRAERSPSGQHNADDVWSTGATFSVTRKQARARPDPLDGRDSSDWARDYRFEVIGSIVSARHSGQ